jgi:hypothetical protein
MSSSLSVKSRNIDKMKQMTQAPIIISHTEFFKEAVREAFKTRKLQTNQFTENYLVQVLEHHVVADHFFDHESNSDMGPRRQQTLAESLLKAVQSEHKTKVELLKKLADRTLYICGFFSDSLQRKIIDVDYCVDMAGTAYGLLAESSREETMAEVYSTYSRRFNEFVEALNYISEKSQIQSASNVLRIYDRYLKTGSGLAREKLSDLGIVPISKSDQKKVSQF